MCITGETSIVNVARGICKELAQGTADNMVSAPANAYTGLGINIVIGKYLLLLNEESLLHECNFAVAHLYSAYKKKRKL